MSDTIPFLDLVSPHTGIADDLQYVVAETIRTGRFIGGPQVENFEKEFAQFCGTRHCVVVNSGTDALRFAYIAAGVRPDDFVITVPNTFIATTEAISQAGAQPQFVDINERTYTLCPKKLLSFLEQQCLFDQSSRRTIHRITGKTVSAIVPVHLYGQMAEMDPVLQLARQYGLIVIEDACQAHGALYYDQVMRQWKKAGSISHAAAFSFYPGKNLGALGEGGAVTTDDSALAAHIRQLRDHGQAHKYVHDIEGYNGRLDAIQAGFLRIKLKKLMQWNEARRAHAALYNELLDGVGDIVIPFEPPYSKAVYHLYVIRTALRDELQAYLNRAGIGTGLHYPIALHLQKAYQHLAFGKGRFPVTEQYSREIISLPMYPELSEKQIHIVAARIKEFFESRS